MIFQYLSPAYPAKCPPTFLCFSAVWLNLQWVLNVNSSWGHPHSKFSQLEMNVLYNSDARCSSFSILSVGPNNDLLKVSFYPILKTTAASNLSLRFLYFFGKLGMIIHTYTHSQRIAWYGRRTSAWTISLPTKLICFLSFSKGFAPLIYKALEQCTPSLIPAKMIPGPKMVVKKSPAETLGGSEMSRRPSRTENIGGY